MLNAFSAKLWHRLTGNERNFRISVLAAGLLALLLRLANVAALARVLGHRQILDAAFYHDAARYLAGASTTPAEPGPVPFANPGYAEFLGALYRLLPANESVALTTQALLGGVTAVVLGLTARALFADRRAGLCAALLWALYVPAIYYDGVLLTPCLTALLSSLALAAVVAISRSKAQRRSLRAVLAWGLAAGICVGFATLLRASNVLLGVALAGVLLLWSRAGQRELRPAAGALALGVALVVAPHVLSQHASSGDWLPVSANGGMNFWVGNNRDADGTYAAASFQNRDPFAGHEYTVVVERNAYLAEARRRLAAPQLSLAEASTFWRQKAGAEISADPLRWLGLEWRKLLWFWNRYEVRSNVSLAFLENFSPILRFDPVGFGVLALLGGFGLTLLSAARWQRAKLALVAAIAAPLATCLAFFVSGEYRHPASCALVLAASFALAQISRGTARFAWAGRAERAQTLALAALAVLVLYPVQRAGDGDNAKAYANWLVTVHPDGRVPTLNAYDRAERILATYPDTFPDNVAKNETLLLLYANRATQFADEQAAEQLIATASKLWQMTPTPKNGISEPVALRVHKNLLERARQVASQPFVDALPSVQRRLALLGGHGYSEVKQYLAANRVDEARAFTTQALELAPSSAEALAERGRVELSAGNLQAAVPWLEQSYDAWPALALPALLLSRYFLQTGNSAQAATLLEEAARREPANPDVQQLRRLSAATSAPTKGSPEERATELVRQAQAARQAEQWPAAIETLEQAIQLGPYNEDLHYMLGSWMEGHAAPADMISYWSQAVKTDPKPQTAYYYWAAGLERAGDDTAALARLAQALEVDPAHEMSELRTSEILDRQGKHEPALAHCLTATRIFPDFRQAHEQCARIVSELGRVADAERESALAQASDPKTPRRFLYWARYLAEKGRTAAAKEELSHALAQDPNDSDARALLSQLSQGGASASAPQTR